MSSDKEIRSNIYPNIDEIIDTLGYYKGIFAVLAILIYAIGILILIQYQDVVTDAERLLRTTAVIFSGLIGSGFAIGAFLLYTKQIDAMLYVTKL